MKSKKIFVHGWICVIKEWRKIEVPLILLENEDPFQVIQKVMEKSGVEYYMVSFNPIGEI